MNLQLLYNNEPLDIDVSTDSELQQTSPLFSLEQFIAEYSTPITIKYSDRNCRTLSQYFLELTAKTKTSVPVTVMENGTYSGQGILVIESSNLNREFSSRTSLTGYLLVNVSDYFNTIQGKKLTELSLGGARTLIYTTEDPTDSSAGYWQKFQGTWAFNDDYIMIPVHNPFVDGNNDVGSAEWMNQVAGGNIVTSAARVYPFIKLKYVLEKCFTEHGWTVDFTGINDSDWERLVLYPTGALEVSTLSWTLDGDLHWVSSPTPIPVVYLRLNEFLDPNYTISKFIVQVCARFGWAPIADSGKKECRFVSLKENKSYRKKDWTKYAQPAATEDYKDDPKIYSFRNSFTGNDGFNSDESLTGFTVGSPVATKFDLPNVGTAYDNVVIFCEQENQYYKVEFDSTVGRFWQPFRDNIYDDEVEGSNQEITTEFTTLAVYWALNETRSSVDYYILVPYAEQSRTEPAGLRGVFYWGMVLERQSDNTAGTETYPFSSCVNVKPDDTTCGAWANVFKYKRGTTEYGIEEYWFKAWFNVTKRGTDVVRKFNLPLHELVNFKWDDKILERNIEYLVSAINRPFPFRGYIEATMRRLVTEASGISPAGTIYLRLDTEITATDVDGLSFTIFGLTTFYDNATLGHKWARAFSDPAGTIPAPQTDLIVKFRQVNTLDGVTQTSNDYSGHLTGVELDLNATTPFLLLEYDETNDFGAPEGHVVLTYSLLPDAAYVII